MTVKLEELKHDQTRWRFWEQRHHDGMSTQWVMETDEYKCCMIAELPDLSKWHKDRHPEWETEHNADLERIRANCRLAAASPIMLEALLAAQQGDMSKLQYAIDHATGKLDWHD